MLYFGYLCNQYLSPLTLSVRISLSRGVLDTTLCDKVWQWLAAGRWFSPGTPVSSTDKTDRHDITEILLKVALNTITLTLCSVHYYLNSIVFALLKESSKLAIVNELINILLKGKKKRYKIVYINMNYILYLIKM